MQGFIPRATELVKLGGTFFLAFLPFILVVSAHGSACMACMLHVPPCCGRM